MSTITSNLLNTLFSNPHQRITLQTFAQCAAQLMKKNKLHPHFFKDNSLFTQALHLILFYFKLPYEYTNPTLLCHPISLEEATNILCLFEKRISERLPIEYITHEAEYLGNTFYVNSDVLVPRSLMNTRFKDFLNDIAWDNFKILDLCCGSGCIGISLALFNERISVDLSDVSEKALNVAQMNVDKYALQNRVRCLQSNLFESVKDTYDLIISNPPYVSEKDYQNSPEEFKNEPQIALQSGIDGLEIIHQILDQYKQYLNPKGQLIMEVGYASAKRIKQQYRHLPFTWYKYRPPSGKIPWLAMDCVFKINTSQ